MTTAVFNFPVSGLNCAGCVGRAETALKTVPGVDKAEVNLATRTAHVETHEPDSAAALEAALEKAGYPARPRHVRLDITGMHCGSCVARAEKALGGVPGVTKAHVNLATNTADLDLLADSSADADLLAAVESAGYAARVSGTGLPEASDVDSDGQERDALRRRVLLAGALTLPVFIAEMGGHVLPALHHWTAASIGMQASWMIQFLLITAVLAGPGRSFFTIGLPALWRRAPDMNALVALGAMAAWGYSTVATFAPGVLPEDARHVYFEAAGVIVTLVLLGRFLEARAKGRTGDAIRHLIGLQPDSAQVEEGKKVVERPLSVLQVGDVIRVAPGARVPVDGTVLTGSAHIDESMITGEPVPVLKGPGDVVTGGTVNGAGPLRIEATGVGSDTVLAHIIRMVESAQGTRLPIQNLVNRITLWFVPAVLALALVTVAIWLLVGPDPALTHALVAGVSVLVIACPCAMGLATPTSIMVGTGRAAELGVLFRKGDALQALQSVKVVAFDKTGTLSAGKPALTGIETAGDADADSLLRLAAQVETVSEHPIAHALIEAAETRGGPVPTLEDGDVHPGRGIAAQIDGQDIRLGNRRWMAELGIDLTPLSEPLERWQSEGRGVVLLAIDGRIAAAFSVSDPVKPDSAATVRGLHDLGLRVAIITGDNAAPADALAREIGVDEVIADVLPDGKMEAIRALQRHGPVAFVGDGINDAPALAAADVGIAIGTGTDIAIEAADVVLTSGRPSGALTAISVSRQTMANIRQNLAWAFGYNIILLPVAAGLLYPVNGMLLSPALAAGAMAMSSVLVVSNALRLRRAAQDPREGEHEYRNGSEAIGPAQ